MYFITVMRAPSGKDYRKDLLREHLKTDHKYDKK